MGFVLAWIWSCLPMQKLQGVKNLLPEVTFEVKNALPIRIAENKEASDENKPTTQRIANNVPSKEQNESTSNTGTSNSTIHLTGPPVRVHRRKGIPRRAPLF